MNAIAMPFSPRAANRAIGYREVFLASRASIVFTRRRPKLAAFFAVMPDPVMGAILVYVACFMILAGIQVITSRMLDARRIFVVGIALIFGLSVDMVPGLYRDIPNQIQPLFSSSLAISTVLVVVLNLLFRIGVTKRQSLELTPGVDGSQKIFEFMESQGGLWGA